MVTANDPTKLDPSMGIPGANGNGVSTRPGRLDMAVEFGEMSSGDKRILINKILGDENTVMPSIIADKSLATPAQVQARCAEHALERLYGETR